MSCRNIRLSPTFEAQAAKCFETVRRSDDMRVGLESVLANNPTVGQVVPGVDGLFAVPLVTFDASSGFMVFYRFDERFVDLVGICAAAAEEGDEEGEVAAEC